MNIYHYHPETCRFIYSGAADESPLEPGVFLVPAHATTDAPPPCPDGMLPVFDGLAWALVPIPLPEIPLPPTSEQIQFSLWQKIKTERDRRRFDGGVQVAGLWFLTTAQATSEYSALVLLGAGLPGATILRADWRTMDDTLVDMTPDLARQILAAGFAQVAAIDDAAQAHKAALYAAADPATYDYSTGWPAIFEA